MSYNLEGLKFLKREWDAEHSVEFMEMFGPPGPLGGGEEEKKGASSKKKDDGKKRKRVVMKSQ
jgi:hypothetical protein